VVLAFLLHCREGNLLINLVCVFLSSLTALLTNEVTDNVVEVSCRFVHSIQVDNQGCI
jgi:hypothetical protein